MYTDVDIAWYGCPAGSFGNFHKYFCFFQYKYKNFTKSTYIFTNDRAIL